MHTSARRARLGLAIGLAGLLVLGAARRQDATGRVLQAGFHHLGNDVVKDWPEASAEPEGVRLDVRFRARANASEWTLFVEQRSVDSTWRLKANGVEVARLKAGAERVTRSYPLPAGALSDGENVLSFEPDDPTDDVVLGNVRLLELSLRELHGTRPVRIGVRDAASGAWLPARVTLVDSRGQPAAIYYGERPRSAVRPGVIYVADELARLELPAGEYTSYATRGPEWSLSTRRFSVAPDGEAQVEHELVREVDTTGFVAGDTHIHTLQFSGHGDASADERQLTLAGEGVELAIATDHNHNTDYGPYQRSLGLSRHFTAVVGNEVTTKVGHFNGFPLDPAAPLPDHELDDYLKIAAEIRSKGAKVVILNHPRWPSHTDSPFGNHRLDTLLGRFDPHLELPVDATELINSTTEESDPLTLFRDWFALLNAGVRIFAVGSSDSHTVGEPVGQGRTYVPSLTDDPAAIDVDAACEAIRDGRTSLGVGMFATVLVDGRWSMGETATPSHAERWIPIAFRVRAPSWVTPRKALCFVDGELFEERELPLTGGAPTDAEVLFELPFPAHDTWVVCVALGDGVRGPHWPQLNPYTLAATNPVFLDVDGDGWSCARDIARAWTASAADDEELVRRPALAQGGVQVHMAALALEKLGERATNADRRRRLRELSGRSPVQASHAELRGERAGDRLLFDQLRARLE